MDSNTAQRALERIERPLRLTLLGLWAERIARAFWPLSTLLLLALSAAAFGLQDDLVIEAAWFGLIATLLGLIWALVHGLRAFHRPTRQQALVRLDATLAGQPIAALLDAQATGTTDPAALAVWQAHRARMAARAASARAFEPTLQLAPRDPFALRYVAITALVLALMFGSIWRVTTASGLTPGAPPREPPPRRPARQGRAGRTRPPTPASPRFT